MSDFGDTKKLRLAVIENATTAILDVDGSCKTDADCNNLKYTNKAIRHCI